MPADAPATASQAGSSTFTDPSRRLAREAQEGYSFSNERVRDITEEFTYASSQLQPGQLVKDEFFTLFEAVGALEIMDPKMDSGYVAPDDTFEPEFEPSNTPLDAEQLIWVMDQLLSLEITWHDGYPLSQTVYTSLHIDRLLSPDNRAPYTFDYGKKPTSAPEMNLVHEVLRPYCIALIGCCQMTLQLIQSQNYYEEEDFVTHLFGRELLPKLDEEMALSEIADALTAVEKIQDPKHRLALESRLVFRTSYLRALRGEEDVWHDMLDLAQTISESHSLAKAIPHAFSEKVQRKLATSTPPRPMIEISWEEATRKWAKMCNDNLAVSDLTTFRIIQSPGCLQRAIWAFSYREPPPGVFARARMQDILFGGQMIAEGISPYDLLLTDVRDLVLAGDTLVDPASFQVELTSDPRHICSRIIEAFMDRTIDEYLNLYRMVCQNRCRIRRTFTQSIAIWDTFETEAAKTDHQLTETTPQPTPTRKDLQGETIHLSPLSSWAKFHKSQLVSWTLQLGFETDIYLSHELGSMYHFLARICADRQALLEHIDGFLVHRMRRLTQQPAATRFLAECLASQDWLRSLKAWARATQAQAQALCRLYALLGALGVVRPPKRDFAQPQLLYETRMKPYLAMSVDRIPSADEFERARQVTGTVKDACDAVNAHVATAKAALAEVKKMSSAQAKFHGTEEQWKAEIKATETTSVAIVVAASQLVKWGEKFGISDVRGDMGGQVECGIPEPGKRYHKWWVVPGLKLKG